MTDTADRRRRASDFDDSVQGPQSRWRFSKTISLDSVIVLIVTVLSGVIFLLSMQSKIDQQQRDLAYVQKSLERVEADQKERTVRLERDAAERSQRLEAAIKEQGVIIQQMLVPRLQR